MSNGGIDEEIAAKFNAVPDQSTATISLTKGDIALLINSLSELHKSYAANQEIPYLVGREVGDRLPELNKTIEDSAKKSYDLFAQFANGLMARFVDEASE